MTPRCLLTGGQRLRSQTGILETLSAPSKDSLPAGQCPHDAPRYFEERKPANRQTRCQSHGRGQDQTASGVVREPARHNSRVAGRPEDKQGDRNALGRLEHERRDHHDQHNCDNLTHGSFSLVETPRGDKLRYILL